MSRPYFLFTPVHVGESRRLLRAMLDAVYADNIEEKSVVAITPMPAFIPLFEIVTTRVVSDVDDGVAQTKVWFGGHRQ